MPYIPEEYEEYPEVYKRATTGAVWTWRMVRDGGKYKTISGAQHGAKVESEWTQAKRKNIGKVNETNPLRQADKEVKAAYVKKLNQGGYHKDIADIDNPLFVRPMLALKYKHIEIGTIRSKVYSQPKLDGIRCIAHKDGLFSRQGKPIVSCKHIEESLAPFFAENPDVILDGELYSDALSDNFNEIVSLVRKSNPTPEDLFNCRDAISYHAYDTVMDDPFEFRIERVKKFLLREDETPKYDSVIVVRTDLVEDPIHLDELNAEYVGEGYEGQMVRTSKMPYEHHRTRQLAKRKIFEDSEYEIIDIFEGEGNRTGMAGYVLYEHSQKTFKSGIKGTHDFCRELLANKFKYLGGEGTVRHFGFTPGGVPRFPVTVAFYPNKRNL